ncbi:MAG: MFS transporter [Clostridia bacterium]|nr:MFS transporter [Clostridia bacterium]
MKKQLTDYEKRAWRMVILFLLAYTTVYIGKKTMSVCQSDMIAEGLVDKVTGGTIGTCFLACYAAGQFINGWLGELIHPRYMICGGLFAAGLMNWCMSLCSVPVGFMIIWGVCGYACSMLWSPIIRSVSLWTSDEIGQTAGASFSATIPIGTIFCYVLCAAALNFATWRWAFRVCGTVLCVVAVILYISLGTLKTHMVKPEVKKETSADGRTKHVGVFCIGLVFAAAAILFNGMIKDGLDYWIPTVLNDRFISDSSVVSLISTLLPIFNIFGVYFSKYIYSKYHMSELGTCALMFTASAAALGGARCFIHFAEGGMIAGVIVTVLLAVSSAAMLGANSMLLTFIPLHFGKIGRASAVTGMLNCFSYAAAAVSGVAIGIVSEHTSWETVFLIFVIAAVLGGILCAVGKGKLAVKLKELDGMK